MARAFAELTSGARAVSLERISAYATCAAIVVAPLAFGGVFAWSVIVVALASAVAGGLTVFAYAKSELTKATSPFLLVLLGAVVFTAAQAMPLPFAALGWLSDGSLEAHRGASDVLASGASTGTISYDPGATRSKIVEWASVACLFAAAWIHAAAGRRSLIRKAVCFAALTVGILTAAHFVLALDRVYGIYQPVYASQRLIGPLVNENNLGGFLLLGPFLMIATAQSEDGTRRTLWYAGAAFLVAMVAWSLSRGALLGLAVGATLAVASFLRKRYAGRRGGLFVATALVLGAGVSAGIYIGAGRLLDLLDREGFGKLAVIARGGGLALEHPLFGVGRGAFSAAFAQEHGTLVRYEHAENWLVDGAAEWGIPMMVVVVAVAVRVMWQRRANLKSEAGFAALVTCVAFLVHSLVDFGFELVGIALPFFALLATLLAPRTQPSDVQARTWTSTSYSGPFAVGALVIALGGLGWLLPRESPESLRATLEQAYLDGDRDEFREVLDTAVRAHPAEPVFPLLAATEAVRFDDPDAARWLNRAMLLAPHWWGPHLLAASWLERRGNVAQAGLEIREAAALDATQTHAEACGLLTRHPSERLLDSMIPRGEPGAKLLDKLTRCRALPPELALAIDDRLSDRDPTSTGPFVRAARRAFEAGDMDATLEGVSRVLEREPGNSDALVLRAEVLEGRGEIDRAARELAQAAARSDDPRALIRFRAEMFARARRSEEMRAAIAELRSRTPSQPSELAKIEAYTGSLEDRCGNRGRAMAAYEEAFALDQKPEYLRHVARIAERIEDYGTALSAYTRLRAMDPHDARYERALERIERKLRESSL